MTRSLFARATRSWRALTFGAAFALGSVVAGAQSAPHVAGSDNEPLRPTVRTFSLFGIADQAYTGMRQGGRTYWKVTNSGPSDDNPTVSPTDLSGRVVGTISSPNA